MGRGTQQIERAQVRLGGVELEGEHRADPRVRGTGRESRPPVLVRHVVHPNRLVLPDRLQARTVVDQLLQVVDPARQLGCPGARFQTPAPHGQRDVRVLGPGNELDRGTRRRARRASAHAP